MTRRDVLAGSGVLLLGAVACSGSGDREQAPGAAPAAGAQGTGAAKVPGRRITVRLEGMIATVLTALKSAPDAPVAADFALMDVLAEGDPEIKDRHMPTLAVPRVLLKGAPALLPDAVDGHYAYWLLAGRNLDIVSSSSTKLQVNAAPLDPPTKLEPSDLKKEWTSVAWLADMNALYPGKRMRADWRRQNFVNCVVRLSTGAEIEPAALAFADEDKPIGFYSLLNKRGETRPQRVYKHFIRGKVDATGDVQLNITSRVAGGPGGTVLISAEPGTEGHQELRVSNMPAVWRPRVAKNIQHDTRTFGALFDVPRDERFVSQYEREVNGGRSDGCDCCVPPTGRQALDVDQLPALKDS
jgi:hypothetical protein